MKYRNLTPAEISALEAAGCTAENWADVTVNCPESVSFGNCRGVRFSGKVQIGDTSGSHHIEGSISAPNGIYNAWLHNVTVGNGCRINSVGEYIANYVIGDGCLIENVSTITVDGPCPFGNGTEVSVLNETGGREVVITDRLSSHIAYIMALYRHHKELHRVLASIAGKYAEQKESCTGSIGENTVIRSAGLIKGVNIGPNTSITGALRLSNGTIAGNASAPVHVGFGVIAEDFIICSGSSVEDGAMLSRCFVGQACKLGHGYSASDSLFFSNCQGENGEACAIFAGPFTVTHHKSTLLIAGMFSFMNAGSGSNQSNHMYKLGPIHQGTMERGAKTASDSYVLWPAKIGAFSLVMGRHVTHSDTSNLPFSYLLEQKNTTYLVPGVNLRSVGTVRDAQKWPKRDGRKDPDRLDCINYNLLSPYTIQKMFKGLKTLDELRHASGELSDVYSFHSTKITNSALRKGVDYYKTGIIKFLGNSIIKRLENLPAGTSDEEMRRVLQPTAPAGCGEWCDISGLIAPKSEVDRLINDIENGTVAFFDDINARFRQMHDSYYDFEWNWAYDKLQEFFGLSMDTITKADAADIVRKWKDAVIGLDKMLYEDAKKEFSLASMTGFGADGKKHEKELDFEHVRGDFESNTFVKAVLAHIDAKSSLGDETLSRLEK